MPTRVLIYAPVLWPIRELPRGRSSRIPKNSSPGVRSPSPSCLRVDGPARPGAPLRRLVLDRPLLRRGGGLGSGFGRLLRAILDRGLALLGDYGLALTRLGDR